MTKVKRDENSLIAALSPMFDSLKHTLLFARQKRIPIKPINMANLSSYDSDNQKEVKNPLLRIRVLTYNNVKVARRNLDGILMQKTDFPFEIYIFDDCSTDGTTDIIREYAQKYPNIITDIQPENIFRKPDNIWNKKVVKARKDHCCKYVAMADGDDCWIDPYKLQYQIEFLESNPNFSMCSGGFLYSNDFNGMQTLPFSGIMKKFIGIEYTSIPKRVLLTQPFTTVYRTDATPGYEIVEKYKHWRDVHLWYYTLLNGKGCYFTRVFGVYNISESGTYSGLSNEQRALSECGIYEELYHKTQDKYFKKRYLRHKKECESYQQK